MERASVGRQHPQRITAWVALLLCAVLAPEISQANLPADLPAVCEQTAQDAARATTVPVSVLRAITLSETGRRAGNRTRPWPWTVNLEGRGFWFETREEALDFARKAYEGGARSFDVGCFQINYKWHGAAFASIEDMFNPRQNALYAARFLERLHGETGSWEDAAGAYHSRTPEYAERYKARFNRFRAGLQAEDDIPDIPDIVLAQDMGRADPTLARVNRFPLLQGGQPAALGSLVPAGLGGSGSLFAARRPVAARDALE